MSLDRLLAPRTITALLLVPLAPLACGDDGGGTAGTAGETGTTDPAVVTTGGGTGGNTNASATGTGTGGASMGTTSDASTSSGGTMGIKFDVGGADDIGATGGPMVDECKVVDNMDAVGDCEEEAPPDSFEPEVEWSFTDQGEPYSYVTPLVANLTDDDGNGEIDLCDIPDVIAVFGVNPSSPGSVGHVYVLDGETGTVHYVTEDAVDGTFTPAIGDIDNDGIAEIVTATPGGSMIAFEHDGTKKWEKPATWQIGQIFNQDLRYSCAASLADLDADGDVEIMISNRVFDHEGAQLAVLPGLVYPLSTTTAADLDGDGDLEVILGATAFHHDGSLYYSVNQVGPGHPAVADLDGDDEPEVIVTTDQGISVLEHDGAIKQLNVQPNQEFSWKGPAAVHDIDADGQPEILVSSINRFEAVEAGLALIWSADALDGSGYAAGTAFDFLGDGTADAMYADESTLYVFDSAGAIQLQQPRFSVTQVEYPVVADIDNDGSAEILIVSNGGGGIPPLRAIRDAGDRWISARRIWNQHTYHVTNVREDGTIPKHEPRHWEGLNTFRTNAQIEGGVICQPPLD